jgi:hypothetical protein
MAVHEKRAPTPRGYVCYRAAHPIEIDGRLDKPVWADVPWTEEFVDIEGDAKPNPPLRTRVKMLWDDKYLYVGAELEEPHVWATLTRHDSIIFQDPDFEVFIDPDGDNHNYYEIEINALNTEWDLRLVKPYRDGGPALDSWEIPGLKKAVHVDGTINHPGDRDKGWSVEMAFPWAVLAEFANCPSPPHDGNQWRINFSRVEWDITIDNGRYVKIPDRPEHNWVWSPQGVIDMHRPEKWGYVQFSTARAGTATFRPDPWLGVRDYLMSIYYAQRAYHETNKQWANRMDLLHVELPAGVDLEEEARITLTPDGYIATAQVRSANGARAHWHVRQDSRLWRDP